MKYVSLKHKKYYVYRPKKAGELKDCDFPTDKGGFLMPPVRIGTKGDSEDQLMREYLNAKEKLLEGRQLDKDQIGYIFDKYLDSDEFKSKENSTQKNYEHMAESVRNYPVLSPDGSKTTFSVVRLGDIRKPFYNTLRKKRLQRLKDDGHKGNATVNRETAFARKAIKWGLNNIQGLPNIKNPLDKIDMFEEKGNTRYVTHEEVYIQLKQAKSRNERYLYFAIYLTYFLASRGVEAISLRDSHLTEEGIDVERRKGSKDNIIAWHPELENVVAEAKRYRRQFKVTMLDPYLLVNTNGDPVTQEALSSAMGRLKKQMIKNGLGEVFWTLHKMKSKAGSDSKKRNISGLSNQMLDLYDPKKHVVETGLSLKKEK